MFLYLMDVSHDKLIRSGLISAKADPSPVKLQASHLTMKPISKSTLIIMGWHEPDCD